MAPGMAPGLAPGLALGLDSGFAPGLASGFAPGLAPRFPFLSCMCHAATLKYWQHHFRELKGRVGTRRIQDMMCTKRLACRYPLGRDCYEC